MAQLLEKLQFVFGFRVLSYVTQILAFVGFLLSFCYVCFYCLLANKRRNSLTKLEEKEETKTKSIFKAKKYLRLNFSKNRILIILNKISKVTNYFLLN